VQDRSFPRAVAVSIRHRHRSITCPLPGNHIGTADTASHDGPAILLYGLAYCVCTISPVGRLTPNTFHNPTSQRPTTFARFPRLTTNLLRRHRRRFPFWVSRIMSLSSQPAGRRTAEGEVMVGEGCCSSPYILDAHGPDVFPKIQVFFRKTPNY